MTVSEIGLVTTTLGFFAALVGCPDSQPEMINKVAARKQPPALGRLVFLDRTCILLPLSDIGTGTRFSIPDSALLGGTWAKNYGILMLAGDLGLSEPERQRSACFTRPFAGAQARTTLPGLPSLHA